MFHKAILYVLIGFLVFLVACRSPVRDRQDSEELSPATASGATTITVYAAASLSTAFSEIGRQFEAANPDVTVLFNFAGSQQLAQQLGQGAPADVFASADQRQMEAVIASGRIADGTPITFAQNKLVIIFPGNNPAGLKEPGDLAKSGLRLLLAAPEVPAGRYALDFLDRASQDDAFSPGYKDEVLANVVSYEENVRSVLTKVRLGEADAGIVYASDVVGAGAGDVDYLVIADHINRFASYPITVVDDSANAALAQAFVDFVLSEQGQDTLGRYGFLVVR